MDRLASSRSRLRDRRVRARIRSFGVRKVENVIETRHYAAIHKPKAFARQSSRAAVAFSSIWTASASGVRRLPRPVVTMIKCRKKRTPLPR